MKKIILIVVAMLALALLYSNPNPDPEMNINEFMFTGTGHWSLELNFLYSTLSDYDSILIRSNSGEVKVSSFHSGTYNFFYYFTDQDLSGPLTINPDGDIIVITGFDRYSPWAVVSTLRFGNVDGANVPAPSMGQSVERFPQSNCYAPYSPPPEAFTLCNNPTMGLENDTTGCCGTLNGMAFFMDDSPITNSSFLRMDFPLTTDGSGHFSTRVYSRNCTWDTVCYAESQYAWLPGPSTPISYSMEPGSVATGNLHFLEPLLVGIEPQPGKKYPDFKVYPGADNHSLTIAYSTGLTSDPVDLSLAIYDMTGKNVLNRNLDDHLGVATIHVELSSGVYIANLLLDGKFNGTARFIIHSAE